MHILAGKFYWLSPLRDKLRNDRRYLRLKRVYMRISWNMRNMSMWEWSCFSFYIILSALIILYIVRNLNNLEPPIFELAKICALIGGLILASGFFTASSQDPKFEMRRVGALYLLASIAFVILGLSLPIYALETKGMSHYIFLVVTIASMIAGAVSFALATSWLIIIIPKLLRKQ